MRGLYAIVDPALCCGRDPRWVARQILHGGCAALQLRAKGLSDGAWLGLARDLRALCRAAGVPFWLNDRADLALLADADGLHLGQNDLHPSDARVLWGRRPIGISTHTLAQAEAALRAGADVLGFGPVFATQSKVDPGPTVGLTALATVCAISPVPVVAIGGIQLDHLPALRSAGASTCAVISALCGAADPGLAARELSRGLAA